MLTWEDDVEVRALHNRGWSISAIARHTGFDRKTVRKYLAGDGKPGERARPGPDPFDEFVDYVTARLTEDPHLWARTLYDELEPLGFTLSYQSLTRNIRTRDMRPVCEACRTATQRPNAVIPHPPGEETQWDWLELPDPPASWGWGKTAHLLVGSLAHSGRWRGWLSPSMDQGHLVAGLDAITRGLGGCPRVWRFDRMATVCDPGSGRVTASFAGVAKHYGNRGVVHTRYGLAPGSADLVGLLNGRFFALEVKTPTGRLRPEQKLWMELVRRAGGFAAVARSVDEARSAVAAARAEGMGRVA